MPVVDFDNFISQFIWKPSSEVTPSTGRVVNHPIQTGKSQGERLINHILQSHFKYTHNIDYMTEFQFPDLPRLRFDFYLRKYNCVIEFDGDQHYRGSKFTRTREEWLNSIERDELKNDFCKRRGISLLRVPQAYTKHPKRLQTLLETFLKRVESESPVYELDLYFQLTSGQLIL